MSYEMCLIKISSSFALDKTIRYSYCVMCVSPPILGQLRSLGEVTWSEKNLIESIRQFKQQEGTRQEDFIVPVFVYR